MLTFLFPVALLLLSGGALFGALLVSRRERLQMERRVKLVTSTPEPVTTRRVGIKRKGLLNRYDMALQRAFIAGVGRVWGLKSRAPTLVMVAIMGSIVGWVLAHVVLRLSFWLAIPIIVFAAFLLPRLLLLHEQKKTERQFTELFPDTLDAIVRMLRAGLPITSAITSVSVEAPAPVNGVFAMIAEQIEIGAAIDEAFDTASRNIGLSDFRFFAVVVMLQHATGGNLAATLEILSDIIRKRRAVRLKAKAATSEIRVSAYVLGALPILVVAALLVVQPGYLTPLIVDPRGHVILAMVAGGLLATALSMRQMMRSVTNV